MASDATILTLLSGLGATTADDELNEPNLVQIHRLAQISGMVPPTPADDTASADHDVANSIMMHHAAHQPRVQRINGGGSSSVGGFSDSFLPDWLPIASIHPGGRKFMGHRASFVIGRDRWFERSDIPCMHDLTPFDSPPVPIVEEWDPNTNVCIVYGNFASLSNVKAYLRERNDPLIGIKLINTTRFVSQVMHLDVSQSAPSPSSKWLSSHHGPIPVQTARGLFSTGLVLDNPHVKFVPAPLLAEVQIARSRGDMGTYPCVAQYREETVHVHTSDHTVVLHREPRDSTAVFAAGQDTWVTMRDAMDVDGLEKATVAWTHALDRRDPIVAGAVTANFLNNVEIPNAWQTNIATDNATHYDL